MVEEGEIVVAKNRKRKLRVYESRMNIYYLAHTVVFVITGIEATSRGLGHSKPRAGRADREEFLETNNGPGAKMSGTW